MSGRRRLIPLVLLAAGLASSAWAFNEPAVNLALTTILDGGPVPQGLYLAEYAVASNSDHPADSNGNTIGGGAKVTSVSNTHQIVYMSPLNVAGALFGVTAVVPVISLNAKGSLGPFPVTANSAGIGDVVVGEMLQWNQGTLLGRPFGQRIEFDTYFPTGEYDKSYAANPGSNHYTFEPFYAFTWYFAPNWESSWRLNYTYSATNSATQTQAGQMVHANYTASYGIGSKFRLGAAGYILEQLTDDKVAGVSQANSRERAFAVGPAAAYLGGSLAFFLSYPIELVSDNRFHVSQTTLQMVYKF